MPLGINKPLFLVRRDGTAFNGSTKVELSLAEINPPLARDIAELEVAIEAERKELFANAAKTETLMEQLDLLRRLDLELHDLMKRPLDEITEAELDAILDRYAPRGPFIKGGRPPRSSKRSYNRPEVRSGWLERTKAPRRPRALVDVGAGALYHVISMRTFEVSSVSLAREPMVCGPADRLLRKNCRAIASACNAPELVQIHEPMHPFLQAVAFSYAQHRPLTLAPDDVWLCLLQGLALHVQENAEGLRSHFVRHEGKKTISVESGEEPGQNAEVWREVIDRLAGGVAEEIGKKRDLFVAGFSTTGPIERAAFQVALLDTLQHYFSYEFIVICGIPSITLLGTPDDWRDLRTRAAVLAEFGLEAWTSVVLDILDRFVAASVGDVDVGFWSSIYKKTTLYERTSRGDRTIEMCGGDTPLVTGWINVLLSTRCTAPLETWMQHDLGNTHESFTTGLSMAPFVKRTLGQGEVAMELVGGFVGIAQNPATLALRPSVGWFVRERSNQAEPAFQRPRSGPTARRSLPLGKPFQVDAYDAATHFDLAVAYLEMGMLDDALHELEIVGRVPGWAGVALAKKGQVLLAQDDRPGAAEAFRRAFEQRLTPEQERWIRDLQAELDVP
ncbi:DUF4419 domain-containing protein [Polyangium aurulentum]|uniref:DUF4419 domain-containing protein n=1 Tax=Polyangium aurulentum TaxID=2567896 RepID=UPI0010AE2EAE|nr:DUF4419 domain-containing protein [Polyangium aurulentum]UQA61935.1 DUF4419 domain-containing protein [Polyangium aurulentum]